MSREGFMARTSEGERAAHDLFLRRMAACGVPFEDACAYAAGNAEAVRLDAAVRPYRFVCPGDVISVGSTTLRVIDTAGHTADHRALYDERRGLLFSGDHVLFDVAPSVDAYPGARDGLGMYVANLHAMCDLPVRVAFPGHGDAIRQGFAERACTIAQKKMRRCKRALYAVQECPGLTGAALARRVFARRTLEQWQALPPLSRYYFLLEAFVCLQHLYVQGRIERMLGSDGVWRYVVCR